jgi:hypothetical protein
MKHAGLDPYVFSERNREFYGERGIDHLYPRRGLCLVHGGGPEAAVSVGALAEETLRFSHNDAEVGLTQARSPEDERPTT